MLINLLALIILLGIIFCQKSEDRSRKFSQKQCYLLPNSGLTGYELYHTYLLS
jgi:hypothetical protein